MARIMAVSRSVSLPYAIAFLAWRTAMGPLRAMVVAISVALGFAWPAGTRWLTRPAALASSAFMRRPVKISSLASGAPTMRGSSCVPPMPGKMPSVVSGTPNTAVSPATTKSDRIASSQPPASAKPSTAAITGMGQRSSRIAPCSKITCWARHCSSLISLRSLRSPPAQNAFSPLPVKTTARASGSAASADPVARAVVFTGSGEKAFCAGGDLKERNEMSDEQWRAQHVIFEQGAMRLLRCPIPVIAAVEGFALAGGCELAILSDFVVAGETAVFGVPETTLGIFPGIGGTQLLPRILGAPLAKELIFTGRRMKADEAKAAGLVNHLVARGGARAKALELAETIARNGPIAIRQAKKAIAYGLETDLDTAMILAIEAYNATVVTEDRLEGVRAFNEKRKPQFKGR